MEQQVQPPSLLSAPSRTGRPWLASCLLQRQVVNVSTLEPVGRVADIMFDPQHSRVAGITIQLQDAPRGAAAFVRRALGRDPNVGTVAREHIVALNGDVVMVDANPVHSAHPHALDGASSLMEVCELVVLTTYGMSLGALADLLVDYRGGDVRGYVVKPTELAKSMLPLLEDLVDPEEPEPQPDEAGGADAPEVPPAPNPPAPHLRVIPASSRIHIGDSLVLVVAEVEPLPHTTVVISQPVGDRSETPITSR